MSVFANDSNMLILVTGLVLFGLVAAFLFWTRPRPGDHQSVETDSPATIATRSAIGDGRSLITVQYGEHEHLLLIGPQSDLLIDSRRIPAKNEMQTFKNNVPMPFPPAPDFRVMSPRVMPIPQPIFEPAAEPYVPQVVVPQPQPAPEPIYRPAPAPRIEPAVVPEPAPVYQPPVYQTLPPVQPAPASVTAPNPQPYDNVFQASIQTHQSIPVQNFSNFEPVSLPPAAAPIPEPEIAVPAFLQSKINPVMMEQALPPEEALPPHWPENHDHDSPISNWEAALPPLRAPQDIPLQSTPIADPTLDLAARQLEDALRQKLAETHQKVQEPGYPAGFQPSHAGDAQATATAAPATQSTADAAADRFEPEIRKLLGRDLKKL